MDYKKINLTWSMVESGCKTIAQSINALCEFQGLKYDCIISIGRGGMVPARILSEYLNIETVYLLNYKSYSGTTSSTAKSEPLNKNIHGKSILLVDDCMATGKTYTNVLAELASYECKICSLACLYTNKNLQNKPTYFHKEYDADTEWIVFPWEKTIKLK